jgi:hypothetical protein
MRWAISFGGEPVPPVPIGKDFGDEIFHRRRKHVLWLDPQYDVG